MDKKYIWKHFILDLHAVSFSKVRAMNEKQIQSFIWDSLRSKWFTVLWEKFYFFWNSDSFTWIFLLSESHFSIHTWPEIGYVWIDLFTCNYINGFNNNIDELLQELLKWLFDDNALIEKKIIDR